MREEESDLSFAEFNDSRRLYPDPTPERDISKTGNYAVCLARDSVHSVPETWFTQLAFGESPDAVEKVLTMSPE
jgi:hypothetical protein